jgi:hypothetical protein
MAVGSASQYRSLLLRLISSSTIVMLLYRVRFDDAGTRLAPLPDHQEDRLLFTNLAVPVQPYG